jgi:hypothetical protein
MQPAADEAAAQEATSVRTCFPCHLRFAATALATSAPTLLPAAGDRGAMAGVDWWCARTESIDMGTEGPCQRLRGAGARRSPEAAACGRQKGGWHVLPPADTRVTCF